jgi:hypothetical protein
MTAAADNGDERVAISLSRDAALILFEFLSRFSEDEELRIAHQAEERVLWNMQCDLEKALSDPLSHDYPDRLQQARERVRDHEGPSKA